MPEVRRGPSGPESNLLTNYTAENMLYVGKHGDDWVNTGINISKAFRTFTAALAAAVAAGPLETNRYVLYCEDAGEYAENLSLPAWVSIFAPNAKLLGSVAASPVLTLADNAGACFGVLESLPTQVGVYKPAGGSGVSIASIGHLIAGGPNPGEGGGIGAKSDTPDGVLSLTADLISVGVTAVGIGDESGNRGKIQLAIGSIRLYGANAIAVAMGATGIISGYVSEVSEFGAGVGTGLGIKLSRGQVDISILALNSTDSWSANSPAKLRIFNALKLAAGTGTAFIEVNGVRTGSATLAAGEVIVSVTDDDTKKVILQRTSAGTGAVGQLIIVAHTGTVFVVRSLDAAGALAGTDDGTFDWVLVNSTD